MDAIQALPDSRQEAAVGLFLRFRAFSLSNRAAILLMSEEAFRQTAILWLVP